MPALFFRRPDVRESDFAQGVDAVTAVHIGDFAGDTGSEVGAEEGGGVAHFFDGDAAFERRGFLETFEHFAEVLDAGGGQRANRAGADAIDADTVLSQVGGKVADGRFQRGFGEPHGVVVGDGFDRAEVGEREGGGVALDVGGERGVGKG